MAHNKLFGIIEEAAGAALITAGALIGGPWAWRLVPLGIGLMISGIGTLLSGDPVGGGGVASRNPVHPWEVQYGRAKVGGVPVYIEEFGSSNKYLDMVLILAAHQCQYLTAVCFDNQRIPIDTTAVPSGVPASTYPQVNGGTSYTPVQQNVNITQIIRANNVVTVSLPANIPTLQPGDQIIVQNVTGDRTLNGKFRVAQILDQVFGGPGSITFTYLCGGNPAIVDNEGQVLTAWADYGRNVYVECLPGTQVLGETFYGILRGTPNQGDTGDLIQNSNSSWSANCSLVGKTCVFLRLEYSQTYFPSGIPQITFHLNGKSDIQDPRATAWDASTAYAQYPNALGIMTWPIVEYDGVTYTATQNSINEPPFAGSPPSLSSYWSVGCYTENATLCIADYLTNQIFGFKTNLGTDVPLAPLIAAANVCDEAATLAQSYYSSPPTLYTEPMYACNGRFPLTLTRGTVLENLLTSCAGRILYTAGQFIIQPGYWPGVSWTLGGSGEPSVPSILAGPFKWQPRVSIKDLYNGCKGTYISPANAWQSSDFPPYAQDGIHGYTDGPPQYDYDANLAADGGDRRWKDIQLPFTISASAAQRIAKIELLRSRQQGTGTFALNMVGYQFTPFDVMQLSLSYFGWTAKLLEVHAHRLKFDQSGEEAVLIGTEIDVQDTDSSVYAWDPETEELTPQGYQQSYTPSTSNPENVTGLSVTSTQILGADGQTQAALLVEWTAPADAFASEVQIQFQLASSPPGPWTGVPSVPASVTQVYITDVFPGQSYYVEVRTVNVAGVPSGWDEVGPVAVSADPGQQLFVINGT